MECPLCESKKTQLQSSLDVERIISCWEQGLKIDVRGELRGVSIIELYKCRDCALQFFKPNSIAGSPSLYEQLGRADWYYMPRKWEHDVASEDLEGCENGIELGCGFGDFVARVSKEMGIQFEGCEQNPSAVKVARDNGVHVHLKDSESLAKERPGAYAAVCSFQVLEHVTDPAVFLKAACHLLRPGGKLIFGVPNAKSFLRYSFNPLDMPPHHMTRWTDAVLRKLPRLLPLKLVRVAYEPLRDYHVDEYVLSHTGNLSRRWLRLFGHPGIQSTLIRLIRHSGIQHYLLGHTIYACYRRV